MDTGLQAEVDAVARMVAELRPAVIHAASDFKNSVVGRTVAQAFGLPYVYEVRGFWEITRLSRHPGLKVTDYYTLVKERESQEARAADAVVTLARTMGAELVERGVPDERITLVPNAVDADEVTLQPRDPDRMRRLGLDGAELVVGYVTSLVDYEGVETLVNAVSVLRESGRDVRLLVVGDGPMHKSLVAQAQRLRLGAAAVFTGRVPHAEVSELYACLDVFVVPRRDVPVCRIVSPLKPYEAMLLGLPVVVSDLPVLREFTDSGAVELFPADEPEALAKVLGELIDDPERRRANAQRGRDWVLTERTWDGNAVLYRDLYERLTQRGV
jgi:glycosyltransferase involved in cell wall biosynthesis